MDGLSTGLILEINGCVPSLGKGCWIAPTATIIGDVIADSDCSFWFGSVVRGDVNSIRIGARVNIQDLAVIHGTYGKSSTTIGSDVSIGHRAIIHGCTIEDRVLIGMGAIVMDDSLIKEGSIIAAGAVLLEGTQVEPGAIYAGAPAKKVKQLDPSISTENLAKIAAKYCLYSSWYRK
jgi:carbonic anhydrase/acetyltransferase-like protein (isoleucine patch superfamily)